MRSILLLNSYAILQCDSFLTVWWNSEGAPCQYFGWVCIRWANKQSHTYRYL